MKPKQHKAVDMQVVIKRLVIIYIILIIVQLFRWQVLKYDEYSALANAQRTVQKEVITKRGTIYTSDGIVLSVDSPSWDVILSITNKVDIEDFIKDKSEIISSLAQILDLPSEEIAGKISDDKLTYKVLYSGATKRQKDIISEKRFTGIYTEEATKRIYPNGTLASHIVGYVGKDAIGNPIGNYGLEGFFWGDIKGKKGLTTQENDLMGNALISKEYKNITFREGKNLILTINSGIQRKVEKILAKGVKELKAAGGAVVVLNPKTGEILSLASYPNYDPNYYWQVDNVVTYKNKAVSEPYEFGSVQKPMTIAMAMNEGKLSENDICNDTGVLKVLDKKLYNYGYKKYGKITPKQVLQYSDNICAAKYGLMISDETMYKYLVGFGYSQQLGIGLQEEETSYLRSTTEWVDTDRATIAYGQTISATPLQIASAVSVIANDGLRMQPYLVRSIYNNEGRIDIGPVEVGQIIKPEIAKKVSGMMEYATMGRPEFAKYRYQYRISGKTGTAQIAKKDGPGYYDDKVNVTFVGFAPSENARFVMVVKIEEPRKFELANQTVLPLWSEIFDAIKDDIGVPRSK